MKGLKYIWFIFLLAVTSVVVAQESYVIDSLCINSDRTYRMDGTKNSYFRWNIYKADSSLYADSVAYNTYMDVNRPSVGDTTWGSEIIQLWDEVGDFDIIVLHWTDFGCDTVEQGRIRVFEKPYAEAGADQVVCSLNDLIINGDSAANYSYFEWTSTGDGTFSDSSILHPNYYFGAADSLKGSATLVLTAYGLAENSTCQAAIDSLTLFLNTPQLEFTVNNIHCYGDSAASIGINATGGIAPYSFSWTGPNGFTADTDSISNLGAGVYIVTLTDNNDCVAIDSVTILQPLPIEITIDSIQHITCFEANNGAAFASATGGIPPFNFQWQGQSGFTAVGDSVFNLPADTFLVTLTDSNLCIVTQTVVVNEPEPMFVFADSLVPITCYLGTNGAAFVDVRGGTAPYRYQWNTSPAQDSAWAVGLSAGEYVVTITDSKECSITDTFQIDNPPPLVLLADSIDVRCGGKTLGEIDLTVSGGIPFSNEPYYLFEWRDSSNTIFATTEDVNSLLGEQAYTVLVTDSLGCQESHQVFINESKNIELAATIDSTDCYGDLWSINIDVKKGKKPYTFYWTDSEGVIIDSVSQNLIGVPDGFYRVVVNDRDGCDETLEFNLQSPDSLFVNGIANKLELCEGETVELTANAGGGSSLYNYRWLGADTTFLNRTDTSVVYFSGATAGIYQLISEVQDESGCLAKDTILLQVTPSIQDTLRLTVCEGELPYTWQGEVFNAADTLTQTISSATGCDTTRILELQVTPSIQDTLRLTVCESELPYTWQGEVFNAADTLTQTISSATGCDTTRILELQVTPSIQDTLRLTVCESELPYTWQGEVFNAADTLIQSLSGGSGCDTTRVLELLVEPALDVTVSIAADTIEVEEGESISITASPQNEGSAPVYSWYVNGIQIAAENGVNYSYIPQDGDTVYLLLLSSLECAFPAPALSNVIKISVNTPLDLSITSSTSDILCHGESTGSITLDISKGSGNYTYQWTGPNNFESSDKDISKLLSGTYTVLVKDTATGLSREREIDISQPNELGLTYTKEDVGGSDEAVGSIDLTIQGGTAPYQIQWTGINGFNSINEDISGLEAGNYTVLVKDANECLATMVIQISGYGITCPIPITLCPGSELPKPINSLAEYQSKVGEIINKGSSLIDSTFKVTDSSDGNTCPENIIRTYSIENTNGDTISCQQLILLDDIERPTVSIPSRTYRNCFESTNSYTSIEDLKLRNPWASYSDNCKVIGIELINERESGKCPLVITRTYRVYDACGNYSDKEVQTLTFIDETPPQVGDLPDLMADCKAPDPFRNIRQFTEQGISIVEYCNGPVEVSFVKDSLAGDEQSNIIYRIYSFTDGCNNTIFKRQRIQVEGLEVPVFDDIEPLCQHSIAPVLPDTSANGMKGFWKPSEIVTSRAGKVAYTFTSNSRCAVSVVLNVKVVPEITIEEQSIVHLGFSTEPIGSIEVNIKGGTGNYTYNWSNGAATKDIDKLSVGSYTLTVTDELGCTNSATFTIEAKDPNLEMACPSDLNIVCPSDFPPMPSYKEFVRLIGAPESECGIDENTFVVRDSSDGNNCPEVIYRTYKISNVCENIAICVQKITISDTTAPLIVCPEDLPPGECLTSTGASIATIEEFILAGGALSDNCQIDSSSFTVSSTFEKLKDSVKVIHTFSIKDLCGNESSCQRTFISTDIIPPEVICNSITIALDSTGSYILTDMDVRSTLTGLKDNCTSPDNLKINFDLAEFTCENVDANEIITITVTDEAGNSKNCQAEISIEDDIPPTALCRNITLALDATGQAKIVAEMIDAGSYDNCKLDRIEISKNSFDCMSIGENKVELYAIDAYGLRDTCEATVTVVDSTDPTLTCKSKQIIQLDENASYTLTWQMVIDDVADKCGVDTVQLDKYTLDCSNIGITYINATVYNVNGNTSTCQAEFEVFGNIPPNASNDSVVTTENTAIDINVVQNDYDLKTDIDYGSLDLIVRPANGSVSIDTSTGVVTYTPEEGFIGRDVFRYSICDDAIPCEAMCDQAFVFISVRKANEPPIAENDSFGVPCLNLTGNVLVNDSDPEGDEIRVVPEPLVKPHSGILTLSQDGNFDYIPYVDFAGIDSFQYVIYDMGLPPRLYDTAWVYITRVADNDCDGIADVDDIDDDNDGIRDIHEGNGNFDTDNDGIPDSFDIDSDNDGIPDNVEGQGEDNYINPVGWRDDNKDGWDDIYDPNYGGYPFDVVLTDTDGDGTPDFLDINSEDDGVYDYIEGHDENADGIPDVVRLHVDSDFDGLDDAFDTHFGWGLDDNETGSNAPLQDFDGDGIRDWRDANDENDQYQTIVEDLNQNDDYSDDDLDLDGHPEYLDTEMDCELFIPEGFSPNDDGVHDFFQIHCIYPRYPEAKLMIFNRQGQKLFEKENYGNYDIWGWEDAWWWGRSENKLTIGKAGGLPAGNYVYILDLANGEVKNGTVMIAY